MPGVLDAQCHIGREVTYNNPVTPTRSFEVLTDPASANRDYMTSMGFRAGTRGERTGRRRKVDKGAEGPIEVNVFNAGFGMLLRALSGSSAIAQVGASTAYLQTHEFTSAAPVEFLTVQVGRPPDDPTAAVLPWTYSGGVVTEFEFNQSIGDGGDGLLKASLSMDYATESSAIALATPVYPSTQYMYAWPDCQVTLNGVDIDTTEFKLSGSHGRKTDRYYLRQSVTKKQPIRTEMPEWSSEFRMDYKDNVVYDLVRNGTEVPLVVEWNGPQIGAGPEIHFLRMTCAAVQLTGETPNVSLDDLPNQPITVVILDNSVASPVKIEYQSTDTAF